MIGSRTNNRTLLDLSREEDRHIDERLRLEPIAWLATVTPRGAPRSVPVWFLWEDPAVVVFSMPSTQKVRSLQSNPHVWITLNASDGGNDIVLLGGRADLPSPNELSAPTTSAFVAKYQVHLGEQSIEEWAKTFSQPIRVTIDQIAGWTKPGGQLRYRQIRP